VQQQAGDDADEQADGGDHEREPSVLGIGAPAGADEGDGVAVAGETGTANVRGSEGLRGMSTRDGVETVDGIE